jgi:hypothetical protein
MQFPRVLSAWACIAASLLLGACHAMAEQPAAPPTANVVSLDSLAIPLSAGDVTLQLSGDTVAAAHPAMRQSRTP